MATGGQSDYRALIGKVAARNYNPQRAIDAPSIHSLELIHRAPSGCIGGPALLFVHGAYVGAWCWDVYFLRYLADRGHPSSALSLRGHGSSGCDIDYSLLGIDDYVDDVERACDRIEGPLILVGHSMGALVVRRLLGRPGPANARVLGGVLMAPVPSTGLTPMVWGLAFRSPRLLAETHQVQLGHAGYPELTHIRRALFSAGAKEAPIRDYFRRMQREAQRALFEMSMLHLLVQPPVPKAPLLVLGAADDGFFVRESIAATAHGLAAPCEFFPDMAHAMLLEPGWREVADRIVAWTEHLAGTKR